MKLVEFSVSNPVKVTVGVVLLCIFGTLGLLSVPVQLTPDVSKPIISVYTRWPGASPAEVEKEIIQRQEEQLHGIEGLRTLEAECRDGAGDIDMEFRVGTDMREALIKVNNALGQITRYPDDALRPRVRTVNIDDSPVCWMALVPLPPTRAEVEAFLKNHPELRSVLQKCMHGDQVDMPTLYRLAQHDPRLEPLVAHCPDPRKLRLFAEDVIEAELRRVPHVANANVYGGQYPRLEVQIDPARLAARGITIAQLREALVRANKDTAGGDIWEGKRRYVIRTLGQFTSPEQVRRVIVAYRDGSPVLVQDVARVRLAYGKPLGVVRQRGMPSIAVNVQKESDANVLEVMEGVRAKVEQLNRTVLAPRGLKLEIVSDQTTYIYSSVRLVRNNIFVGGALAVLVLWFFLRRLRPTLIVALSIPISVVGSFLVIHLLGRSINVITLAGLAFAVGMVVDAAIVVLENIFSHYQRGTPPRLAADRGTTEVWGAILASTLTTLAVFVPVVFVEEQAGQLFRDLAIAISAAVALSMIVSLTVIPTASAGILQTTAGTRRGKALPAADEPARADTLLGRFTAWVVRLTDALQQGAISWPWRVVLLGVLAAGIGCFLPGEFRPWGEYLLWRPSLMGLAAGAGLLLLLAPVVFKMPRLGLVVAMIVASLGFSWRMMPGAEYLPEGNRNLVYARIMPPPGYNLEKMIQLAEVIEERLRPYWEAAPGSPEEARLQGPRIANFFLVARNTGMFMGGRAVDPARAGELVEVFRRATQGLPDVVAFVGQSSLFERSISGGRTIDIQIVGHDLEKLMSLGREIMGQLQQMFPPETTRTALRPIPALEFSTPELRIQPDLVKAAELGISTDELGYAIDALVDGAYVGRYWHQNRQIDLVITAPEELVPRTQAVEQLPIGTPGGEVVPLAAVASLKATTGPDRIVRIDRQRAVTVQVKPGPQIALEDAMNRIQQEIVAPLQASGRLEGGRYQIRLGGTADELRQMISALGGSMLLAVVITYLLLAGLYESFLYPLVIMVSVPMAAVGGFLGLRLLNLVKLQPLDTLTMLGFIILVGTVVNNAILIVNQALVLIRQKQMPHRQAVTEAVRGRVRPILMSTMTTLLGMLPLVLFPGAGSELYRGLGSVVLGGLLLSTVFTLVLVPMLFTLTYETQLRLTRRLRPPAAEPAG